MFVLKNYDFDKLKINDLGEEKVIMSNCWFVPREIARCPQMSSASSVNEHEHYNLRYWVSPMFVLKGYDFEKINDLGEDR